MSKIVGNVVGIPNPQSDFNQNDPSKADYIKNKPTTLSGYGITDAYTKSEVDAKMGGSTPVDPNFEGKITIDGVELYVAEHGAFVIDKPETTNEDGAPNLGGSLTIDNGELLFNGTPVGSSDGSNIKDLTADLTDNPLTEDEKSNFMHNTGLDKTLSDYDEALGEVDSTLDGIIESQEAHVSGLDVFDLKMVRDTLGIDVIRENDIVYEYTGGTYRYKRIVVLEDYVGACSVVIGDFKGLECRLTSADGAIVYKVITSGAGVYTTNVTAGLAIHLQVSKATAVEPGTYYVKGITVYTGDITSKKQGLPSYFTGAKKEVEKLMVEPSQTTFMHSVNMANPDKFSQGRYWAPTGSTSDSNATYFITGHIYVQSGTTLWANYKMRFITAFDKDLNVIAESGATDVNSYTVPEGVSYVVITGYATQINNYMVNVGDKSLSYTPYAPIVDTQYIDGYTKSEVDAMLLSGGTIADKCAVLTSESLAANKTMTLTTYPKHLKKNNCISFTAKFDNFTGLYIGKGRNQYRGRWLEITATDVIDHSYNTSDVVKSTIKHGLTISNYIGVSIVTDNDSTCYVTINTLSGSKTVSFNWEYEHNGHPFVTTLTPMTNCKLSATSPDFDKDVWMFGDSYFGVTADRVIGQLKNLGFINNVLIDGLAGSTSANSKGDLDRALNFGHPKTLVWCLGMNDSTSSYETYFNEIKTICEQRNIELIAMRIASVPGKEKESINAIIDNSGVRSVNTYEAVGATSEGAWYNGYLSSDNVHPSILGARAIAMRMLIDAPEIMRSGYYSDVIGDIETALDEIIEIQDTLIGGDA